MAIAASSRAVIYGPLVQYPTGLGTSKVNLVNVTTPWGIRVLVHRYVERVFRDACEEAARVSNWKPKRIDSFAPRNIRASSAMSLHSYALAWDFFATPPNVVPPGGVWTPDNPVPFDFANCFVRRGFRWGRSFSRTDLPHIEWAEDRPTAQPPKPPAPPAPIVEDDMNLAIAITATGDKYRFGRGTDGRLWMKYNDDGWVNFDGSPFPACTLKAGTGPAADVDPATGRITVTVIGTDSKAYEMRQTGGANSWTGPVGIGGIFG